MEMSSDAIATRVAPRTGRADRNAHAVALTITPSRRAPHGACG